MKLSAIVTVLLLFLFSFPNGPASSAQKKSSGPTRFHVYRALVKRADLPLAPISSCGSVLQGIVERDATLGDWIAYNLSLLEGQPIQLPVVCRETKSKNRWSCEVTFVKGNERSKSPWSWGVRAVLSAKDGGKDWQLDAETMTCTGAG